MNSRYRHYPIHSRDSIGYISLINYNFNSFLFADTVSLHIRDTKQAILLWFMKTKTAVRAGCLFFCPIKVKY